MTAKEGRVHLAAAADVAVRQDALSYLYRTAVRILLIWRPVYEILFLMYGKMAVVAVLVPPWKMGCLPFVMCVDSVQTVGIL